MTVSKDAIYEAAARAAHEANRAYCIALGDMSQAPWNEAPDWQRKSCIVGVKGVLEDGNGPRESHESWLKEKAATGWKYGPVKDPEKKEHPCFVAYDELPAEQRLKDTIFTTVVRTVAGALGHDLPNAPSVESRLKVLERKIDDLTVLVETRRTPVPETLAVVADPEAWVDDPSVLLDILSLVCEEVFTIEDLLAWTPEQRKEAETWAAVQHAVASDNEVDEIPPMPVHVRELRDRRPKRDG